MHTHKHARTSCTLELGGNDPCIVRGDCDIKKTAQGVYAGAFSNTGQICVAIKRAYVHESIFDEFVAALAELARAEKVGDGFEEGVTMGPLSNIGQFNRGKNGARVAFG
jgi:acyl-CoA reductase-like NAD-dependent aldehyde dehydrogenase